MLAAGASAGVSVAFGAPIGGALFTYEMSKPATFWKFSIIWKIFFTCSLATFIFAMLDHLGQHRNVLGNWSGSALKFGTAIDSVQVNTLVLLPGAILMGLVGGLLGSFFVSFNTIVNRLRKKYLKTNHSKVLETMFWSFLTASVFFLAPLILLNVPNHGCHFFHDDESAQNSEDQDVLKLLIESWCTQDDSDIMTVNYNGLGTLLWNTEGSVIRIIMNHKSNSSVLAFLIFFVIWYLFTVFTYGTNVPSGLFVPGMLIGCAIGSLFFEALHASNLFGNILNNQAIMDSIRKKHIIIGATSFLAGYTRMTYSLGVIMMETSQDLTLFVPMIFSIVISNQTGYLFT